MFGYNGGKLSGQSASVGDSSVRWSIDSTSGTIFSFVPKTDAVRFTGTGVQIRTIVPKGYDGQELTIYNATGSLLTILCAAIAGYPNEHLLTTSSSIGAQIQDTQAIKIKYSTAIKRWVMSSQQPMYIISAATGLTVSANNGLSQTAASTSTNGYLTAANWNTFNNKPSGSGNTDTIAVWSSVTGLTTGTSNDFTYKLASDRMGIQQQTPLSALHVVSAKETTISAPTSLIQTLKLFTPNSAPSPSSATQAAGHLMNPDSPTATENASGAGYNPADTVDYYIVPYNYDGDVTYTECVTFSAPAQVVMVGTNGIDLSWTADSSGTVGISGYYLYRSVNGGGYGEYNDVGNVTSFSDDATTGWTSGAYPHLPQYNDFIAINLTRTYHGYSKDYESTLGLDYFSSTFDTYSMTDNNTGKPFRVDHVVNAISASARVLGDANGTTFTSHIDGLSFSEYPDSWTSGSTVSPSTFGYLSNNTVLNRDYLLYHRGVILATTVFNPNFYPVTTTDPNDGLYYYIQLDWAHAAADGDATKILVDTNQDATFDLAVTIVTGAASGTFYDTGSSSFSGSLTVTPTGILCGGVIIEKTGTSADAAHLVLKGTADYSRIEFSNSSDVIQSYITSDATALTLKADSVYVASLGSQFSSSPTAALAARTTSDSDDTLHLERRNSQTGYLLKNVNSSGFVFGGFTAGGYLSLPTTGSDTTINLFCTAGTSTGTSYQAARISNVISGTSMFQIHSTGTTTVGVGKTDAFVGGYVAKTANYTLTTTDFTVDCTSGTFTLTLPTAVGVTGQIYNMKNSGAGVITLNTTSSQTIDGNASGALTLNAGDSIMVQSNNANWIIL